jgi:hypothetical protein
VEFQVSDFATYQALERVSATNTTQSRAAFYDRWALQLRVLRLGSSEKHNFDLRPITVIPNILLPSTRYY